MKKTEIMITTYDNPYDPFEEFDKWYQFDSLRGYFTPSYIDRIVQSRNPNALSKTITEDEYDASMKEIVEYNPDMYHIVSHTIDVDPIDLID